MVSTHGRGGDRGWAGATSWSCPLESRLKSIETVRILAGSRHNCEPSVGFPECWVLFQVPHSSLNSFILPILSQGRGCYCPHFIDGETEAERNSVTYVKSHTPMREGGRT